MARLETKGEPSMEEILASIRKIIAEEPPGSRPVPAFGRTEGSSAGNSGLATAPQRGFMARESFLRSPGPEAQTSFDAGAHTSFESASPRARETSARTEPSLSFERTRPGAEDFSKSSLLPELDDIRAKIGKAAGLFAEKTAESAPSRASKSSSDGADAASIEGQLNDLLNDFAGEAKSTSAAGGKNSDTSNGVAAHAAGDLVPPASAENNGGEKVSPAASDPFAFDLGPSPFAMKGSLVSPEDIKEGVSEASTSDEGGGAPLEAEAGSCDAVASDAPGLSFEPPKPEIVTPSATEVSGDSDSVVTEDEVMPPVSREQGPVALEAAETASVASEDVEPETPLNPVFVSPSVNATMGPTNFKSSPVLAAREDYDDRPATPEFRPLKPLAELPFADLARRVSSTQHQFETRTSTELTTTRPNALADDAMEDAVADLLRPMLRTWLAENMPRIVERALRREMLDTFDQRKGAAE